MKALLSHNCSGLFRVKTNLSVLRDKSSSIRVNVQGTLIKQRDNSTGVVIAIPT